MQQHLGLLGLAAATSLLWLMPHVTSNLILPKNEWLGAAWLLVLMALLFWRTRPRPVLEVDSLALVTAALVLLALFPFPWVEGLHSARYANATYLFLLLLSVLAGRSLASAPGAPLAPILLGAMVLAGVGSVALQLVMWTGQVPESFEAIWTTQYRGNRPFANLAQPNQLGTLLVMGVVACAYFHHRKALGGIGAWAVAAFLLLGVALTQSRSALLSLLVVGALALWQHRRLGTARVLGAWVGVVALLALYRPLLDSLLPFLPSGEDAALRPLQLTDVRLEAWRVLLRAALEQPWWGYGWGNVATAFVSHNGLATLPMMPFAHSHNLVLDLVIWLGIPLGLLVALFLAQWFWRTARQVQDPQDALVLACLLPLGTHAMLELPLHYLYFLMPAGLLMGHLAGRLGIGRGLVRLPLAAGIASWALAAAVMGVMARDVLVMEKELTTASFEVMRIGTPPTSERGSAWLLLPLNDRVRLMQFQPSEGMSTEELDWLEQALLAKPSAAGAYLNAKANLMNGRPEDAQRWLARVCQLAGPAECDIRRQQWAMDPWLQQNSESFRFTP